MKSQVRNLIIAVITIAFIYVILTNISISNTIASFKKVGFTTFLICCFFHFIVYYLRCVSMSLFIGKDVKFGILLNAHFFHNFYLNIFPASMGELSLPFLVEKWVDKMKTMAVLLITRLFSLVVTLLIFASTMLIIFKRFSIIKLNWTLLIAMLVGGLVASIALYLFIKLYRGSNKFINKLQSKLISLAANVREYAFKQFTFSKAMILTVIAILNIVLLAFYVEAVFIKLGINVSFIEMLFIMMIQVVVLILPIKSFGGFGTFEGSWVIGMLLLGFNKQVSLESGLVVHILQLLTSALFFLIGLIVRYTFLRSYYVNGIHNE